MHIKLDPNDKLFSIMIRERDGDKCVFCGKSKEQGYTLQNSHFWGRGHKSTRFDPKNCDCLCFSCHINNEGNKQGMYRTWKLNQLGEQGYKDLELKHNQTKHYGAYEKKLLLTILKDEYKEKKHLKKDWDFNW